LHTKNHKRREYFHMTYVIQKSKSTLMSKDQSQIQTSNTLKKTNTSWLMLMMKTIAVKWIHVCTRRKDTTLTSVGLITNSSIWLDGFKMTIKILNWKEDLKYLHYMIICWIESMVIGGSSNVNQIITITNSDWILNFLFSVALKIR